MHLPDGLTTRPLTMADVVGVAAVMAAQELLDAGEAFVDEADLVGEWQRPSFDPSTSTIGVFDNERLVAYAEDSGSDRGDAGVHPDYRGRGIGTQLARWMQQCARARGGTVIGMPTPAGSPGERLLTALGYHVRWTSWVLRLPADATIAASPVPPGYAVGEADPSQYPDVHEVIEDAFLEWSTGGRVSYEDFRARTVDRPGFEPWHIRVVTGLDGSVVGAVFLTMDQPTCLVDQLAVHREHRHRGLARALLADSFARGRERGAAVCELSTDSTTGALSLYERLGMVVVSTWLNYAIEL